MGPRLLGGGRGESCAHRNYRSLDAAQRAVLHGLTRTPLSSSRKRGPITTDGYDCARCFRAWLAPSASRARWVWVPAFSGEDGVRVVRIATIVPWTQRSAPFFTA